jgi:hypothetical protein
MLRCDRITTSNTTSIQTGINLLNPRMHRLQAMQSLPELRRQPLTCLHHIGEERVAAGRGPVQHVKEGRAGRLLLKGHVGVPGNGVGALLEELGAGAVVGATEDEVDFWEPLGGTGGLVYVVTAEVAGVVDGFLDGEGGEVLVAEG